MWLLCEHRACRNTVRASLDVLAELAPGLAPTGLLGGVVLQHLRHTTHISRKQFRCLKPHFVDVVSRFDVIILSTGENPLPGMFVCSVCARSSVLECPMMTQIRLPHLKGLFGVLWTPRQSALLPSC